MDSELRFFLTINESFIVGKAMAIIDKVEIFLEQREVAFLSPSKICENLNFSTVHL